MRTDLPATLFWLGNDLMWIKYRIYQKAPTEIVLCGFDSVRQYLNDLEVDEITINSWDMAREFFEQNKIQLVDKYIDNIKRYVHLNIIRAQPTFRKLGLRRDNEFN